MNDILGISVCARNEAASIIPTLESIKTSLQHSGWYDWKMIVCTNGCTDDTPNLVNAWIAENSTSKFETTNLQSANLVEAQRTAVEILKRHGATLYIFFDADLLVDRDCVAELCKAAADPKVKASYAKSIPFPSMRPGLVEMAYNLYDSDRCIFTARKHLHGRAFLIKEWQIPPTKPSLLADDIYLSCDLLLRHGENAIKAAPSAIVYFHQVNSVTDAYHAFCRRKQELQKCLRLFPAFTSLPPNQLNRQLSWKLFLEKPYIEKMLWLYLLLLRRMFSICHSVLTSLGYANDSNWVETLTTKRSPASHSNH